MSRDDFKSKSFRNGGSDGAKRGGFGGGQRREGGFSSRPPREGGFRPRSEGGFPPREGGFRPRSEGGFPPREGGFRPRSEGGFPPREGGFNRPPREGGFPPREGGFRPREGGFNRPPREGGFRPRSEGGFNRPPREGAFERKEGQPSQGIVSIELVNEGKSPQYMSLEASGMDVFSNEEVTLKGGSLTTVHTGVIIRSLPPRTVISVRSRSSLAKDGLLLISPTIISHLDGVKELVLTFLNLTQEEKIVKKGDRVGQIVFNIVEKVFLDIQDKLTETERNTEGFGSTGV